MNRKKKDKEEKSIGQECENNRKKVEKELEKERKRRELYMIRDAAKFIGVLIKKLATREID